MSTTAGSVVWSPTQSPRPPMRPLVYGSATHRMRESRLRSRPHRSGVSVGRASLMFPSAIATGSCCVPRQVTLPATGPGFYSRGSSMNLRRLSAAGTGMVGSPSDSALLPGGIQPLAGVPCLRPSGNCPTGKKWQCVATRIRAGWPWTDALKARQGQPLGLALRYVQGESARLYCRPSFFAF